MSVHVTFRRVRAHDLGERRMNHGELEGGRHRDRRPDEDPVLFFGLTKSQITAIKGLHKAGWPVAELCRLYDRSAVAIRSAVEWKPQPGRRKGKGAQP